MGKRGAAEVAEQAKSEFAFATEARTMRFRRVLPGPIERVWAYLTESEKLVQPAGRPAAATSAARPRWGAVLATGWAVPSGRMDPSGSPTRGRGTRGRPRGVGSRLRPAADCKELGTIRDVSKPAPGAAA
jgi:hypothetical protein